VENGRFGEENRAPPMGWRAPSKRRAAMQGECRRFGRKQREAGSPATVQGLGMTYRIEGLDPARFAHLVGLSDDQLAAHDVVRMKADARPGFPCRIRLDDAAAGETLLLVNHISHDGNNPYRASHAIFVSETAAEAAVFEDAIPPALDRRILSLRAFDGQGMMSDAALAQPGEGDAVIRRLLTDQMADHIDAHNAIPGCFAARIERN
jgi:hypothetical protein